MKKHTRFGSVLLMALLIVSVVTSVAFAKNVEGIASVSGATVSSIYTDATGKIVFTVTSDVPSKGTYDSEEEFNWTAEVTSGSGVTVTTESGTASFLAATESGTATTATVEVPIKAGSSATNEATVIKLTIENNNFDATSGTGTVTKVVEAPVVSKPNITTTGETTVAWGSALSIVGSDTSDNPAQTGTWTVDKTDDELAALGLAITSTDTAATIKGAGTDGKWTPTAAVLDAMTTSGTWKGENLTKTITLTRTVEGSTGDLTGSKEITLTFQGLDIELSGTGATNDDWKGITTDTTDLSKTIVATGPGTLSFDIDKSNLPWLVVATEAGTDSDSGKNKLTATFTGVPNAVAKSKDVTVKATINGGTNHAKTVPLVISVAPGTFTIKKGDASAAATDLPHGNVKNKDSFTSVTLKANPGPIVWSGYDFLKDTAGLTVTESEDAAGLNNLLIISGDFNVEATVSSDYTINAKNSVYTEVSKDISVTGDDTLTVWVKPTLPEHLYSTPDAKKDKNHAVKSAASEYTTLDGWATPVEIGNVPDANKYKVVISVDTVLDLTADSQVKDEKHYPVDSSGNTSEYGLGAKVSGDKLSIVGSTDRVPAGGKIKIAVYASNYAGDSSKEYDVSVIGTVTEIAKKNPVTLASFDIAKEENTSADLVTGFKGDPTQTMTAVIDEKTAQKVFGYGAGKTPINLLPAETDEAGQKVLKDIFGENFYIEPDYEKGSLLLYANDRFAFKKLPITITTKNVDYNYDAKGKAIAAGKEATSKVTVDTAWGQNDVPVWLLPESEALYELNAVASYDVTTEEGYTKAAFYGKGVDFYTAIGKALPEGTTDTWKRPGPDGTEVTETHYHPTPFRLGVHGYGPLEVTVKPEEANGIKAVVSTDKEWDPMGNDWDMPFVVFTGTPKGKTDTKDLATKFTLTAKNPSTGKSAKATVTFTSMPTVEIEVSDSKPFGNTAAKPATVGKKLKAAPKITKNSKNILWKIESADWKGTELTSQDLSDIYGITLDAKSGTTKGTLVASALKAATGTDNPLTVHMKAYTMPKGETDVAKALTESDVIDATIYIVGDKVKVATKTVTITVSKDASGNATYTPDQPIKFTIGKDDISAYNDTVSDTNTKVAKLDGGEHTLNYYKANMAVGSWKYDKEKGKPTFGTDLNTFSAYFADEKATALSKLTLKTSGDNFNTFKLDGAATPTKKATLQLAMNNWGTVTTGKVSVVVKGQVPEVNAKDKEITLASNDATGKEVEITLSNADYVGSKIKWKVTSKTTGVKAKFTATDSKNPKAGGTLKITTDKKFTDTQEVVIEATDGDTKSAGTAKITVKLSGATANPTSALDVNDTTSSAKDEAKVLGEGTVTMGFQRTVASLTAGQRAQIEAKGYIIAAVLPEIETDADGQYDFEVDLDADERVKAGDELVWFAFASKPTTDDEIVDFEDLDGNETKVVPEIAEGHEHPVVVAWPWLNAGTKYAPVIAVKADAAEADAMTEEGVKEAAEEAKE